MKRYLPVRAERARSFPDCDSADVRHESLSFCAESRFEGRHSPFAGPAFRLQPSALPPPGYPDGFRQAERASGLRGLSQQISRSCGLERSMPSQPASERVALRAGGPADYRAFARVASLGAHRASSGAVALRLDFSAAKKVFLARAPTVFLLRVYGLGACRASVAFQLQGGSCASSKTRPFPSRGPGETVERGYDSRRGILQAS